jgi:hypothetical protein
MICRLRSDRRGVAFATPKSSKRTSSPHFVDRMHAPAGTIITLDLPLPPSVNRLRRVDWASFRTRQQFYTHADLFLVAYGPKPPPVRTITGAYELTVQIPDGSRLDLDNHHKALIDYLVSREFVAGDSKKYLRRLVIEWGAPTEYCRITIQGVGQ